MLWTKSNIRISPARGPQDVVVHGGARQRDGGSHVSSTTRSTRAGRRLRHSLRRPRRAAYRHARDGQPARSTLPRRSSAKEAIRHARPAGPRSPVDDTCRRRRPRRDHDRAADAHRSAAGRRARRAGGEGVSRSRVDRARSRGGKAVIVIGWGVDQRGGGAAAGDPRRRDPRRGGHAPPLAGRGGLAFQPARSGVAGAAPTRAGDDRGGGAFGFGRECACGGGFGGCSGGDSGGDFGGGSGGCSGGWGGCAEFNGWRRSRHPDPRRRGGAPATSSQRRRRRRSRLRGVTL